MATRKGKKQAFQNKPSVNPVVEKMQAAKAAVKKNSFWLTSE